jgi:hypothetical protein
MSRYITLIGTGPFPMMTISTTVVIAVVTTPFIAAMPMAKTTRQMLA